MRNEFFELETLRLKTNLIGLLVVVGVAATLGIMMGATSEAFIILNGAAMYFAGSKKNEKDKEREKKHDEKDVEHDNRLARLESLVKGNDHVQQ